MSKVDDLVRFDLHSAEFGDLTITEQTHDAIRLARRWKASNLMFALAKQDGEYPTETTAFVRDIDTLTITWPRGTVRVFQIETL